MRLEELLTTAPVEQWKVGKVYSYGWYDGPTHGAGSLLTPACEFWFDLLDERFNPNGLDDRIYRLSELTTGSVEELLAGHHAWSTLDESGRWEVDRRIQEIRAMRHPTALVIYSQDLHHFLGCWTVDPTKNHVDDWFTFLGIPPTPPEEFEPELEEAS